MSGFIVGAGVLVLLAVAFVLVPLLVPLRGQHAAAGAAPAAGRQAPLLALAAPLLAAALYARVGHLAAWEPAPPDPHQEANRLLERAVGLAMQGDQRLDGEAAQLIQQALAIDPRNVQALALAGAARFEHRDYAGAVALWQQVLSQVPPDSREARSIAESMAKAQALAGEAAER